MGVTVGWRRQSYLIDLAMFDQEMQRFGQHLSEGISSKLRRA